MDYLILVEKPSVARKFSAAFGGTIGTISGKSYKIASAHGHLMKLKEPDQMVSQELSSKYKSWELDKLPWNIEDIKWGKTYNSKGDLETISKIKSDANGVKSIVMATDNDPSGEGQLLAWEIINAIGWKGNVLRMYFEDESPKSLKKAFSNLVDISDQSKDGNYLKADSRSKWDFLSMQLTRISTTVAKQAGYNVKSIRQGRLKSVIVRHIYEQLEAIKHYKKVPYFEIKFKDQYNNVFARKDENDNHHPSTVAANQELQKFSASKISIVEKEQKTQAPGQLLDLASLAAILAPKGFSADEVLTTYQKMYEAEYLSYPRTEDKKITSEQFNDILPLVDSIAAVTGINASLLTHRLPRAKFITKTAAHGANRPGLKVPKSLDELKPFGKAATEIYMTLSKNYLATLAEDYIYESTLAELDDYPAFKSRINRPVAKNFKEIFDGSDEDKKEPGQLGDKASTYIYEGANPKPVKPTMKWIIKYLEKYNVGQGSTRTRTLADIAAGDDPMINEKKGVYSLTQTGLISAILSEDTWISSVTITGKLLEGMDQVGEFKMQPKQVLFSADATIKHDMPIIMANAHKLKSTAGEGEYIVADFAGESIRFKRSWSSHNFTDQEVKQLLNGETITFSYLDKKRRKRLVTGKLAKQTYNGNDFWGFKTE